MPKTVEAFRVFLASPSGLEAERRAVHDEVVRFNEQLMHDAGAAFTALGWETVPGGGRRPQDAINEVLETCDFMILLLWNRWGTAPSVDSDFTSGTEEEFVLADQLRHNTDRPMNDILILFKGVPEAQLSDPGEQLKKVLEFKNSLEDSKKWLYKTFDDIDGLRQEVGARLLAWAKLTGSRQVDLQANTPAAGHPAAAPIDGTPSKDLAPIDSQDQASLLALAESKVSAHRPRPHTPGRSLTRTSSHLRATQVSSDR